MINDDHAATLPVFDIFNPEHAEHKWEILAYARAQCPVFRTEKMGGVWVATRHEHIRHILEHPEVFSSSQPSVLPAPLRLPPIDLDPPLHADFRKFLNPLLSKSALLRFEPQMRAIIRTAIDEFIDRGRCEFNREFAIPVASQILAQVIFDDHNEERMAKALDAATRMGLENTPDTFIEMAALAAEVLKERQDSDDQRDDVIGALISARVDGGRPLTEEERVGVIAILFIGGLDTTRAAMGNIMLNIINDPTLEDRVRDPRWIRSDLDELLRFESPVTCLGRVVTSDTELAGVPLQAGERLVVHFASANRDDARFEHADQLDFTRAHAGNAAFGLGIHRCVGAPLARIEIILGFEELLARITKPRLEGDVHTAPGMVHHPEELPISFDRVS